MTVTVDSAGERGLLGVAFDPSFATNHFVYVYYTATTPAKHNRLSRFTANGDVAVAGSETILLELDNLSSATNHNGGALHFGLDGKLYIAVGENATSSNAQTTREPARQAPPPEQGRHDSDRQSVLLDRQREEPRDLGARAAQSLHVRGPAGHGPDLHQRRRPEHLGGDRRRACRRQLRLADDRRADDQIPASRRPSTPTRRVRRDRLRDHGRDLLQPRDGPVPEQLRRATTSSPTTAADGSSGSTPPASYTSASDFATGTDHAGRPRRSGRTEASTTWRAGRHQYGSVFRIQYTLNTPPTITAHPPGKTVTVGDPATFSVSASGTPPLSYQWQRNTVDISGRHRRELHDCRRRRPPTTAATFRCKVTNAYRQRHQQRRHADGHAGSSADGRRSRRPRRARPMRAATRSATPAPGRIRRTGRCRRARSCGRSSSTTTRTRTRSSRRQRARRSGSFVVPTTGHTEDNVWYRIHLTVTDSAGLTHTTYTDVVPRKVTLSFATNPPGLQITLDGQPLTTPATVTGVVGIERTLGVVSPQTQGARPTPSRPGPTAARRRTMSRPRPRTRPTRRSTSPTPTADADADADADAPFRRRRRARRRGRIRPCRRRPRARRRGPTTSRCRRRPRRGRRRGRIPRLRRRPRGRRRGRLLPCRRRPRDADADARRRFRRPADAHADADDDAGSADVPRTRRRGRRRRCSARRATPTRTTTPVPPTLARRRGRRRRCLRRRRATPTRTTTSVPPTRRDTPTRTTTPVPPTSTPTRTLDRGAADGSTRTPTRTTTPGAADLDADADDDARSADVDADADATWPPSTPTPTRTTTPVPPTSTPTRTRTSVPPTATRTLDAGTADVDPDAYRRRGRLPPTRDAHRSDADPGRSPESPASRRTRVRPGGHVGDDQRERTSSPGATVRIGGLLAEAVAVPGPTRISLDPPSAASRHVERRRRYAIRAAASRRSRRPGSPISPMCRTRTPSNRPSRRWSATRSLPAAGEATTAPTIR